MGGVLDSAPKVPVVVNEEEWGGLMFTRAPGERLIYGFGTCDSEVVLCGDCREKLKAVDAFFVFPAHYLCLACGTAKILCDEMRRKPQ